MRKFLIGCRRRAPAAPPFLSRLLSIMDGLQNHPGEREFPVRPHWRYHRPIAAARRQRRSISDRWRGTIIVALILVGWAALAPWALPAFTAPETPLILGVIAAAMGVAVVIPFVFAASDAFRPVREQQRYRRIGKVVPLTASQQRLLALDALSDYASGTWNSSLEYLPSQVRLGRTDAGSFLSLAVVSREQARAMLDEVTGAASEWQLRRVLEDLMKGTVSAQFRAALSDPQQAARVQQIAARTGQAPEALRTLVTKTDATLAPQLRAMDVSRIVQAVRLGFMAGFLGEDEAWELLARVGQAADAHFSTMTAFVENARVATAFLDEDPAAVATFDRTREGLLASQWPAAAILADDTANAPAGER